MTSKIVQISAALSNRQPARRDYHQDMLTAAILQIRALSAEIAALKKMIPPPPFCEFLEE